MFLTDKIGKADTFSPVVYQEGCLLPILKGVEVLASGRYQILLRQLRELADLDDAYFTDLYETLIVSFVEFVQALPGQANGPLFGILNMSLIRALSALQHFIAHNSGRRAKPIYRYAVFSAALLLDVSKVVTQQKIMITEEDGSYVADWLPYLGTSLPAEGQYYKFYFYTTPYSRLDISLTVLLAKQIMPASGFSWISSDFELFADWLDALQGNASSGGRIATTLSHIKLEDLDKFMRSLGQMPIEMSDTTANEYGEQFFKWLKEGIDNGSIKFNEKDSLIHVVEEGVLIEKQLVKKFCDLLRLRVNSTLVQKQFANLFGLANKSDGAYIDAKYVSESPSTKIQSKLDFTGGIANKTRDGDVLKNSDLLILNAEQLRFAYKLRSIRDFLDSLPAKAAREKLITAKND